MSDLEVSPNNNRGRNTLHIDDYTYQEREPKCINSLCSLINSRLKVLENEILTQHKVWESIQKEVDEVKSLIDDCTSTCGSSSSSAQDNDSENVDSAVESHKTCNSLYWGKIRQAEENLEENRSLIRRLSSDVIKLKNSKRKCSRKHTKSKSSVDLILEVTNGLHVLKCDDCKFCSEHLDFREGLLSAVIELVHFTEKNYSSSLEENKALKACLQKIYLKTKSCLLHSQIYLKSNHSNLPFDADNHTVCVDNIYTSFEEFCQHFQSLQDELLQLRQILLAAEENHLDELFQDSHSSNCVCNNLMKKGSHSSYDRDKIEAKLSKGSQRQLGSYDKRLKTLANSDEPDEDPGTLFDSDHVFRMKENESSQQLYNLRNQIYEAVRIIRDVEVEENDDANLVNMVTSLAEECSALRQEVSYLRNVRQEKKRSWNKLQCFIMDAERKLKGNRTISDMKEVINELRQITSSNESSSLDETVLYMYSNQLKWMEKNQAMHETPADKAEANLDSHSSLERTDVCIQTYAWLTHVSTSNGPETDFQKLDIGIQVDDVFDCYSSKAFNTGFPEISREIYVVPEAIEENEACLSRCSSDNNLNESGKLSESLTSESVVENIENVQEEKSPDDGQKCDSFDASCQSLILSSCTAGSFQFDIEKLVPEHSVKNFSCPLLNSSDLPLPIIKSGFWDLISDQFNILPNNHNFGNSLNKNMLVHMFLNHSTDILHKFSNLVFNVTNNDAKTFESLNANDIVKLMVLKPYSALPIVASKAKKYLPHQYASFDKDAEAENPALNNDLREVKYRDVVLCSSSVPVSSFRMSENLPNGPHHEENLDNYHDRELPLKETDLPASEAQSQFLPGQEASDDEKDAVRPALPRRNGTFVVESAQSLGIRIPKPKIIDENLYYTAILTTLVSSNVKSPEKNYILFEIRNCLNHSATEFECDEDTLDASVEEKHNVQHYVLCDSNVRDKIGNPGCPADICHIIFCKSNAKFENKLFDIYPENNSSFDPLVPQYFPSDVFNYERFESFSLTHSCEIYTCDEKLNFEPSNENKPVFTPKNYLRFKKCLTANETQHEVLNSSNQMPCIPDFHESFTLGAKETISCQTSIDCPESAKVKRIANPSEGIPACREIGNQTDESYKLVLQKWKEDHMTGTCETQAASNILDLARLVKDDAEPEDDREDLHQDIQPEMGMKCSSSQPDHVLREIGLLDEIAALKENLGHQNAVLQRLKEELEDSNLKLEEKESRLQLLQMEHNRLNEIIIQSNIKEVEDKMSQTESADFEENDELRKEVNSLREENILNQGRIAKQSKMIEQVKGQLCSSISHLKALKDSATKQLKKQKHQLVKSFKVKQQLQETKSALEKRCEELEKKNELISNQEFQLHEIQTRLDAALEERNQISQETQNSLVLIKVDTETQTATTDYKKKMEQLQPVTEHDIILKKHSEELIELQSKLQHLETIFSNKKESSRRSYEETLHKPNNELKIPSHLKEGNIWKILMISEQSYLSLLSKLSDSLQLSDLKGSVTLMHASWLNVDELADARRQDHKRILQSLDKLKRSIRYLQETHQQEQRRQNAESAGSDDKKSSFTCHTDEMHFQYLCEVLQRAQETLWKEYSQKRSSHQRASGTPSSLRTSRLGNSRERRIPLELKNGRILALLDDKVSHKDLLPNKYDLNKIEAKSVTTYKSKSSS